MSSKQYSQDHLPSSPLNQKNIFKNSDLLKENYQISKTQKDSIDLINNGS